MRFKHFFLFVCLLANTSVEANDASKTFPLPPDYADAGLGCDLPAPTNFQVEDIGATWVKLTWFPSSPMIAHRVKTYTVIGNILVSNDFVPAGQMSVTVSGLQSGVSYYSTINAICPDGTDSKYKAQTADYDTLVPELIVAGIQQSTNSPSCGVSSVGQYCEFSINGTQSVFEFRPINGSGRQFNVSQLVSQPILRCTTTTDTGTYNFKINGQQGSPPPNGTPGTSFEVYLGTNGTPICTYELYKHRNPLTGQWKGRLIITSINSGYEIVRRTGPDGLSGPSDPSSGFIRERDNQEAPITGAFASATPNPFSETIDVYLSYSAAQQVQVQVFNLNGQQVVNQQFAGGQEQYTLSTAQLSPGFYMLRIEADGVVQTLKVVKSE